LKAPARIGFDASSTVGPRTGIGVATAELLTALLPVWPESWSLKVLVNSARWAPPDGDAWPRSKRIELRRTRLPGRLLLRGWQWVGAPPIEWLLGPLELHHSPAGYLTPSRRARAVLTVHDVYFARGPEHPDPFGVSYFRRTFPRRLASAGRVIASSEFTRGELIELYGLQPERVHVVPLGVDPARFHAMLTEADRRAVEPWAPDGPYWLCVSTIGPKRKNLTRLVEAYARARVHAPDLPPLVIAGRQDPGPELEALRRAIDAGGLDGRVRLTDYLPPPTLPSLYRAARALVIPSLSEGFGLPALEAMACGCPVLAARAGALPEVVGEAALLFDPTSADAIAAAILQVDREPPLREALRVAGIDRARRFTWAASAQATLGVYATALAEDSPGAAGRFRPSPRPNP